VVCREGVAVTQTGCVLITAVPMQTREPRTNWYPRVRSWGGDAPPLSGQFQNTDLAQARLDTV